VRFGGTITGEHGVGIEKIMLMAEQFTEAEIAAFHRLKAAFDEHGLLNPGKGVPTLARCREYTQARAGTASILFAEAVMDTLIEHWIARISRRRQTRAAQLAIRGGGSKSFYGGPEEGEAFDVGGYRGIVAYEPTELVVTARAGTPLAELAAALAEKGQWLAFEPPHFGPAATVGGMLASGLSGPRRQAVGAVRDFVLGVKVLNGLGEVLSFGGQVMKNVAGYDVPRLMAGSLGTLGVVLEVSLKVLPLPVAEKSLRFALDEATALQKLNQWGGRPCRFRRRPGTMGIDAAPVGGRGGGRCRAADARRGGSGGRRGGGVLAVAARADARLLCRRCAAVASVAAFGRAAAGARADADRMGRRAALAARRRCRRRSARRRQSRWARDAVSR
jgi:FAD/FMN-containing dehydrogenase